jgi:hypothetical protein
MCRGVESRSVTPPQATGMRDSQSDCGTSTGTATVSPSQLCCEARGDEPGLCVRCSCQTGAEVRSAPSPDLPVMGLGRRDGCSRSPSALDSSDHRFRHQEPCDACYLPCGYVAHHKVGHGGHVHCRRHRPEVDREEGNGGHDIVGCKPPPNLGRQVLAPAGLAEPPKQSAQNDILEAIREPKGKQL